MFAALADHLWQSVLIFCALALGAWLARRNAAHVRLWMWRIAAFKFVVPFHALFAFGRWLGFPLQHSADPVPGYLTAPIASLAPYLMPVRGMGALALGVAMVSLLAATLLCARQIRQHLRLERWRHARELVRERRNPDDVAPGLGFVRGLLFTAVTLATISSPVLAGAVQDRLSRQQLLIDDSRSLRDSEISMKPAAPGMGARVRITATRDGVFIRNATIRDLAALAYGVNRFFVRGDHFYEEGEKDWLIDARYDISIAGTIRDPGRFDTYALRRPVTRMLAERHGLEIYVNQACQPPCGRYGVPMTKDGL
jgi:hypothetical protein